MSNIKFNAPVGSVQVGNNNHASINQNLSSTVYQMDRFLVQMREDVKILPGEERIEAEKIIAEIEQESKSEYPQSARLKTLSKTLWGLGETVLTEISKEFLKKQIGLS